jgi:hypothetical protein
MRDFLRRLLDKIRGCSGVVLFGGEAEELAREAAKARVRKRVKLVVVKDANN